MTPDEFVAKWKPVDLPERAASQEHFLDLCHLLGQPTPAAEDPTGQSYCFEKAVKVVGAASKGSKGDAGFVDVWRKNAFGWEYKRKDKYKDLDDAYRQLYQYRDALDNPPLSVVCDIRTIIIRAHFSGYPTEKFVVQLDEIPGKLELLRRLFTSPESFKPFKTRKQVTEDLAKDFGELADRLIDRYPPSDLSLFDSAGDPVAHFLMKVMFCLFVEDVRLLPDKAFEKLIQRALYDTDSFVPRCTTLFNLMKTGGEFGNEVIQHFNGGLFDDAPPLPLLHGDLMELQRAAAKDWSAVEPSIFGTLFERILDPKKRAQIGAHYTSREDIMLVIEPVIMTPLRRKWIEVQQAIAAPLATHDAEPSRKKRDLLAVPILAALDAFRRHLGHQRVLDPACGSGNFLYVALQALLDLDDEIVRFAARHDIAMSGIPYVRPTLMHGIEINRYAAELAQVVIWIGYLQWMYDHGLDNPKRPILDKLQCIENRDAILDLSDKKNPKAAEWPEADFIVGNPPFLSGSKIWEGLGTAYRDQLWAAFDLPRTSDLCCYWFEVGQRKIQTQKNARVGLLATQGIRGEQNREVLHRIISSGAIFLAWSDREWVLDGAAVNISIVGFDGAVETRRSLDGVEVPAIYANLRADVDLTSALVLAENSNLSFRGIMKSGPFDIAWEEAAKYLREPTNVNGLHNQIVLHPSKNGSSLLGRYDGRWIIDFGVNPTLEEVAMFSGPFKYVETYVKPERATNKRDWRRERWWCYGESAPNMRDAVSSLKRCIATARVAKHRVFTWIPTSFLPDDATYVFARADDYFLGNLQSSVHAKWSLRMGTQLEDRPRYTATSCFETFPLPWPPGKEDTKHPAHLRISAAAKSLNDLRERWLNPPEWIDPLAARIDATDDFADVPAEARPLIRHSAIMAAAAKDARLKNRTLTKLYNERPTWLKHAHEALDRAVLAAYAAVDPDGHWPEDWADVWIETGAGQPLPPNHPLSAHRAEVDQKVLANLLRLNHQRAG